MFKEIKDICPSCGAEELRPIYIGNDRDGWVLTGDFECDSCGGNFSPFENHKEKVIERIEEQEKYDSHDCDAEDGCQTCIDYREYIDQEVKALNSR